MGATHRIKAKFGLNEFEAEGDPEVVNKQYEDFLARMDKAPSSSPSIAPLDAPKPPTPTEDGPWLNSGLPVSLLDRVFRKGDPLSLLAMPKSEKANADALVVLIFGLTELKGEQAVTGTTLRKSANKSGVNVSRIGDTLKARADLIQAAGLRKGLRYSLNNRGISEAQRIMREMVE